MENFSLFLETHFFINIGKKYYAIFLKKKIQFFSYINSLRFSDGKFSRENFSTSKMTDHCQKGEINILISSALCRIMKIRLFRNSGVFVLQGAF